MKRTLSSIAFAMLLIIILPLHARAARLLVPMGKLIGLQLFELYEIKDVFAGRFHGEGQDLTEEMQGYLSQVISGNGENSGCVVVDQRLAEILQLLMDKYTFQNVDHSWIKLCYYYDYLGPEA